MLSQSFSKYKKCSTRLNRPKYFNNSTSPLKKFELFDLISFDYICKLTFTICNIWKKQIDSILTLICTRIVVQWKNHCLFSSRPLKKVAVSSRLNQFTFLTRFTSISIPCAWSYKHYLFIKTFEGQVFFTECN
jgi:hypothetical protein